MLPINTSIYAVLENNTIINVIIAESKEIAESVTGKDCVEQNSTTGVAEVNGDFYNNIFRPAKPYPSWIWSEENLWWQSPVILEDDQKDYYWDEDNNSWNLLVSEYQDHFIPGSDISRHYKKWMPYNT